MYSALSLHPATQLEAFLDMAARHARMAFTINICAQYPKCVLPGIRVWTPGPAGKPVQVDPPILLPGLGVGPYVAQRQSLLTHPTAQLESVLHVADGDACVSFPAGERLEQLYGACPVVRGFPYPAGYLLEPLLPRLLHLPKAPPLTLLHDPLV